ncbi:Metallo-dependent phosphatase-like protein [Multifurca ochricompacta]|uniref:Metallo-dependent phosphatase-like protein n=1 Tax=Multifurca ochricompacta TaxID=376703 RepID=A0AAD4QPZ0_9AGAM|nr:Metallo-dependent phosphatase-like protein [Multifurca ochricompacta]
MPARPTRRHILSFISLAALIYLVLYSRDVSNSHQHVPLRDVTDNRIARSTRIVAVGDLHGDIGNAQKVLEMARVVDSDGRWSGDVDVFVQTGDIIDRGDDTIKLFDWMEDLRSQAQSAGGQMLSHLGNHEWMNAIGDWRYVHQSEIKTFGDVSARQAMLSTGRIGRAWAANYTTTSRLPLHPSLGAPNDDFPPPAGSAAGLPVPLSHAAYSFVHGGLALGYPQLSPFPSAINDIGLSLLRKLQRRVQPPPHPPHAYPGLPSSATSEEHALYESDGPLWYRGWALNDEKEVCRDVDLVLDKTGTRRMIMGHTPNFQKIVSRCNGKIIIIDTGISHAYGGALSALNVEYTLKPVQSSSPSSSEKKWREREVVKAVYPSHFVTLVDEERDVFGDI